MLVLGNDVASNQEYDKYSQRQNYPDTLMQSARNLSFSKADQIFNVNRFFSHYRSKVMNVGQVEAMYKKLIFKHRHSNGSASLPAHDCKRSDEMAFIGKFLDWLRYRGVDDGPQLLLDRKSSISEQLQSSKGSFEGIAWVSRPGR